MQRSSYTQSEKLFSCANAKLEKYKCEVCPNFRTNFVASLKHHISRGHAKVPRNEIPHPYKCQKCPFESYSEYMFAVHNEAELCCVPANLKCNHSLVWKHADPQDVECERCSFKFKISRSLQSYLKRRRGVPDMPNLRCAHCPFETVWRSSLLMHLKVKHGTESSRWSGSWKGARVLKCDYCPFKTRWSRSLPRHIKRKHSKFLELEEYECGYCFSKYKRKKDLEKHVKEHILNPIKSEEQSRLDRTFSCEHCPYKSKTKSYLKEHEKRKHMDLSQAQWFHCEHCPFKTIDGNNLKKHQIRKHTNPEMIEWFYCGQCPLKFKLKTDLQQHVRIHVSPNTIKTGSFIECEFCTYKAHKKSNLRRHLVTKHTKIQDYLRIKEEIQ